MKSLNDSNHIHDNKVNNISERNVLRDIINLYKITKYRVQPKIPPSISFSGMYRKLFIIEV